MRTRPLLALVVPVVTVLGSPPPAAAQQAAELATAEALFDDGLRLMREGQYEQACPKFEQSLEIDTGIGATLWLADCYEKSGRLASAWTTFRQAAWLAQQGKDERQRVAQDKLEALEPRVPKLTVEVAKGGERSDLKVSRDGVEVAPEAWGVSIPVDPGKHEIVAESPGREPWRTTVTLREGEQRNVSIPLLARRVSKPTSQAGLGSAAPSQHDTGAHASGRAQAWVGWGLVGLGAVSMGVGGYYGLQAKAKFDDSKAGCSGNVCSPEGGLLRSEAQDAANRSTLLFAVGAAVAVGGGVTLLLAPDAADPAADKGVALVPTVGPSAGGLAAAGRF